MKSVILLLLAAVCLVSAKVYYKETFDDASYTDRWVVSTSKDAEGTAGKWELSTGDFSGDDKISSGLKTSQDARFYQISSKISEPFSNKGETLVLQFSVKHEQKIDCGGGYIKILPAGLDQATFNGDSPYNIMFGPDICGSSTKRIHAIFNYKGENHLIKKDVKCETDQLTHVYTLIVKPDNTYQILVDGEEKAAGSLTEDWDMLPPKEIKDPEKSKPEDWVDEAKIADPEDKKPEGYDDIQPEIVDPEAEKPEDWDDELDGDWEAPMIDNPEYKGPWRPKMIDNPEYKGEWEHPLIPNPDYVEDNELYAYESNAFVGFEIWQVKAGTIFDSIFIGNDVAEAKAFADETYGAIKDAEKTAFDKKEDERRAKEDAERKAREAEEEEEEEDEEEEDDEKDEL